MTLPTSLKRDLERHLPNLTVRAAADLPQTMASAIFTISNGWVEILALWGEVTTVIQTQANNTKLVYDPTDTGASTDLCAVLNISADAVETVYSLPQAVASAMEESAGLHFLDASNRNSNPLLLKPGEIDLNCAASNTGQIKWYCLWRPVASRGEDPIGSIKAA